ncbi:anthranilate 1,2-dioxygenase ferredoxin subunit AndAb [Herbaspirillum sp. alder98]|uniref:anthranilate 1,2-dioxygenase ferredoxin subunit AndAb n=1 Tax=Herbaspirillum sp. alder98 TaxID=2913096 RepID=UPI001CD88AE9|nr:anthranilate 1,2-dioxygenase ferredoxin subunit AndAb [Herbaspirillum sp. alder98]MCA1325855.1 Rieske 2Fe-2S domain-containing protein [Herbaspirillum sp. alder98]
MSDWFQIGTADAFGDDAPTPVHAGGQQIAIFRLGDELFALKDLCTHGNARLSDGYVEDGCVECPLHQGLFDIRSGAPRSAPITEAVRCFPVRVVAGQVEVEVGTPADVAAGGCTTCNAPASVTASATVTALTRAAADVAIITLQHDAAMPYRAGQYLDVLLENGKRRSYSMATPPRDGKLELHVRHLPGGLFTDRVFATEPPLQAGDTLMIEGPAGSFWLREGEAPVILLASGTGFAPVKAIVEQAIADGSTRSMRLYWGGRTPRDLYHDALCRDWAARLPWLQYEPILSAPLATDSWQGRTGLVHQAVMQDFPDLSGHQVYACGAPAMVAAAQRDFTERCGLAPAAFLADAFLSAADR